ncbi:MAG: MoxR family ATPase [Candidatus Hydrogenedentota bacterium]
MSEKLIDELKDIKNNLISEVHKVIIGQDKLIESIIISLFADGHILLEGVPGLAKTLTVTAVSKILDLKFSRIQFTPDLMPTDITGTDILEVDKTSQQRYFKLLKGPLFGNIILADEINRTPPKTQAALLQAMQEREVSIGEKTISLDRPYLVLATQNPIELEGTYPLPEAQLDRFLLYIKIGYPSFEEEMKIASKEWADNLSCLNTIIDKNKIIQIQQLFKDLPVSEEIIKDTVNLVRRTRPEITDSEIVKKYVRWGCGPRASQHLVKSAKVRALLEARVSIGMEDVKYMFCDVLRHRIVLNYHASADGITQDTILKSIII